MNPEFRLATLAMQDIEQIADYIAQKYGLARSDDFLEKLEVKFSRIAQFPLIGRQRDEILPGIRCLMLETYLILYVPIASGVEILRVVSGYRDLSTLFSETDDP